ncbi:NAD(P)-dependent dehydrogenase (short-subunit alcohol dehydrogenase family) [Sphingomonas vulcanisoli]|uniref:NAD(P)-dependent dehydrogenase (Short-subunit alcohol dehydrogenase family) n=1 Tax=Sphingomonas vulcanisoli TaxID=1658060 RepID=A0ABX0TRN1_9SPHN|nr:SDR family NAD(P)-dependent oxidoreductase [Sphingomonas vulcanisoli]NIJ08184.1 NAD(P)-dependent dehydrogenase (short-subunit alcohol dehydrogenase family) [Sphingomonas vulcanisoli]
MGGELQGKIALVTGGGSGIGRATSLILAREGATIAVADRDRDAAEKAVADIRSTGATARAFTVDIANEEMVASLVADIEAAFGGLDLAFNNAGIGSAGAGCAGKAVDEVSAEAWHRMLDVNLTGLWHCMVHELRAMRRRGGGAIVNNASVASFVGVPRAVPYTASKHGVLGLTRASALEQAVHGIRINAVCPGLIDTPLMANALTDNEAVAHTDIPLGRLGRPEEVGELVSWMLSDRASFCTGTAFLVDGGQSAI